MAQIEFFGINSIKNLSAILKKEKTKNIFLVTGKKSYKLCGAKEIMDKILKNKKVVHFNDFKNSPKIQDVKKGVELFKQQNVDLVIAIGGGSVIDIAKSINFFANQKNGTVIEDCIINKDLPTSKVKKIIAIPTTSGSGSEATKFAVIYINKTKYSLENKDLLPSYVILDPQFIFNLPPYITACTGMDALSQAIESYWSVNSNEESKKYSTEAISLIIDNLERSVRDSDKQARVAMSRASNLAGKAINIAKTTACHAISYPFTSYFNIPHGQAVALTLGNMLRYNYNVNEKDVIDIRGVDYVKENINSIIKLLKTKNINGAKNTIEKIMINCGLKINIGQLGLKKEDLKIIIDNGFNPSRMKNNPRRLTENKLREILLKLF